jgi:hypothetical protein
VYESNGPDIKIRGTASHVAEKYVQLARDARSSGDPVAAENYYQHAEHYYRIIAAAQEQFRQNQQQPRPDAEAMPSSDDSDDDGDGYSSFGQEPGFVPQQQQPYVRESGQPPYQREPQQQQPREHREREHRPQPQYQPQPLPANQPQPVLADTGVDRLPSFITGGAQPQVNGSYEGNGGGERSERGERFPRRRRRPHGPRPDTAAQPAPSEDFNPGNE